MEQKGGGREHSLSLPDSLHELGHCLLPSDGDVHHWHCGVSGLWTQARATLLTFLGFQMQREDHGTSQPP